MITDMDSLDLSTVNEFLAEGIKQIDLSSIHKYEDKKGVIDESLVNEKGEDVVPTTYIICVIGDEIYKDFINKMYNVYEDAIVDTVLDEYFETMKDPSPVNSILGANLVVQAIAEVAKSRKIKTTLESLEDAFIAVQVPGTVARNAVIELFY
jgi:hypothetical protein